jgi:uncharacterized protein
MKLDREPGQGHVIRGYRPGELRIDTEMLHEPCVVMIDRLLRDWRPPAVADLALADFEPILALQPEVILLGTGARQQFPPAALLQAVLSRGVGLEVMATDAACRTFNVLASEYRRVAAALYTD